MYGTVNCRGRPPIALRCLLLMLVSTPLRIVNRCCSGVPLNGGLNIRTFNLSWYSSFFHWNVCWSINVLLSIPVLITRCNSDSFCGYEIQVISSFLQFRSCVFSEFVVCWEEMTIRWSVVSGQWSGNQQLVGRLDQRPPTSLQEMNSLQSVKCANVTSLQLIPLN